MSRKKEGRKPELPIHNDQIPEIRFKKEKFMICKR